MITLYHSPNTRSSRILALADEMGVLDQITIKNVSIRRFDGSGGPDAANPHPEGKVPLLDHDGTLVFESAAIVLYLTDLFADHTMGPKAGEGQRGDYLSWLFWYGSVMEPALLCKAAEIDHPYLRDTWRSDAEVTARLHAALARGPWLMGDHYTAVDLLVQSPYGWMPSFMPDDDLIRDWVKRCQERPAWHRMKIMDHDQAA